MRENDKLYKFKNRRRSNLDDVNLNYNIQLVLDPKEKSKFDEKVKNIMEKLSKIDY